MSNISRRRIGELQRGAFKILLDQPDGLPAKEIISRMAQIVPPTEFEKNDYPKHPGIQRFGKIIRFATIGPVKAGWLIRKRADGISLTKASEPMRVTKTRKNLTASLVGCITNGLIDNPKIPVRPKRNFMKRLVHRREPQTPRAL